MNQQYTYLPCYSCFFISLFRKKICALLIMHLSCLELPQLRSDTSLELGCDARGYSRAGNDIAIWYCVIVAGRPGIELSKRRQVLLCSWYLVGVYVL